MPLINPRSEALTRNLNNPTSSNNFISNIAPKNFVSNSTIMKLNHSNSLTQQKPPASLRTRPNSAEASFKQAPINSKINSWVKGLKKESFDLNKNNFDNEIDNVPVVDSDPRMVRKKMLYFFDQKVFK
jgi:hypothetical protein